MTNQKNSLSCFKAYDIRGKIDDEINEDIAYRIGVATVSSLAANSVVVGFDARETSPKLADAVVNGIVENGADVLMLGLSGTEEMYWAVSEFKADAGIVITASHNPIDYNGMKIVKSKSKPLSEEEFFSIREKVEEKGHFKIKDVGRIHEIGNKARFAYIDKVLSFVDTKSLKPLKIVINSGNGAAGPVVDALDDALKARGVRTNFVRINHNPDSTFPQGIPNPLLVENHAATSEVVLKERADFGVAFDGDFDRCFFFDNQGNFVPGEYVVGLLSEVFLSKDGAATIVHDPRVVWNTLDIIQKNGAQALVSKTGHAFVKRVMHKTKAIYGGEMSAHHYFRDFACCDSGIVPWLLIWEYLSGQYISLAEKVKERQKLFPSSGEINFNLNNPSKCLLKIKNRFASCCEMFDEMDGLSMSFKDWRFNLRQSQTEPLVRLNVETRGKSSLLSQKTKELSSLILNE